MFSYKAHPQSFLHFAQRNVVHFNLQGIAVQPSPAQPKKNGACALCDDGYIYKRK